MILLLNILHVKNLQKNCSHSTHLEFEYLSKSENMQWVCNICKEQSNPMHSHVEAKIDLLLEMMPKMNDLQDRMLLQIATG